MSASDNDQTPGIEAGTDPIDAQQSPPAPNGEIDELPGIEAAPAPAPAPEHDASGSNTAAEQNTNHRNQQSRTAHGQAYPFEVEDLEEFLKAYNAVHPQEGPLLEHYFKMLESASGKVILPRTITGDLKDNFTYVDNLLMRTRLVPNDKDKTILTSATAGGEINYSKSGLKYSHKDFGFDKEKNKTLFGLQDAINMALHARHRPDMLPPNGIKLTGSEHYRVLMQRAVDLVNSDLPDNAKIHITNRLDDLKVDRRLGPLNPAEYQLKTRPHDVQPQDSTAAGDNTNEQQDSTAAGDNTNEQQTSAPAETQQPPTTSPAPQEVATADSAPEQIDTIATAKQTPPVAGSDKQDATAPESPAPAEESGEPAIVAVVETDIQSAKKYSFDSLDETIKSDHIALRRKIKGEDYAVEKIQSDWDNRSESFQRLDTAKLQARQFENQIAVAPDVTKIARQIGVTKENPNLPVYEGEFRYAPHATDAMATVRFVLDGDKPLVLRIANHGPYVEYNSHKYKLDDKPKSDFEAGASASSQDKHLMSAVKGVERYLEILLLENPESLQSQPVGKTYSGHEVFEVTVDDDETLLKGIQYIKREPPQEHSALEIISAPTDSLLRKGYKSSEHALFVGPPAPKDHPPIPGQP